MSKQIISNQKITGKYKITTTSSNYSSNTNRDSNRIISGQNNIMNTLEHSTGNMQQRSTDNQSICTCGKFRTDTHSTYNRTIQTNLRSEENTCDEGKEKEKDLSLCNCYKKYANKTTKARRSNNSQNILIEDNNYSKYEETRNRIQTASENNEAIMNTNIATDTKNKKICICGLGEHEAEIVNTASSINEHQVETIETKDEEIKEKIEVIKKISEIKKEKIIQTQEKREIISWTNADIFIQIIERMQYLAAEPPALTVQFPNEMMINRTIDNRPIQILIPIPENYIQKQSQFEVLAQQEMNEPLCAENVDLLNISNAYSIYVPNFDHLEIENLEIFIKPQEKKNLQIENYSWDISACGPAWTGPIKPVKTNKFDIDQDEGQNWNKLVQKENVEKFEVEKKDINYRFKNIELGDNEIIILKATKRVLKNYTKTEEAQITMGGKGFKIKEWEPIPFLANSMTIVGKIIKKKLEKVSQDTIIPSERKRRPDWKLVNTISLVNSINYLAKEKIMEEQNVNPLTIIEENNNKNKWKDVVKKQNGVKLLFEKKNIKKWELLICKEINMFFEHEMDDVIVNDDYNNISRPQMRPVVVTVLKMKEDEETSSVTSYDVLKNVIIKQSNLNINIGYNFRSNMEFNNRIEFNKNNNSNNLIGNKESNKFSVFYENEKYSFLIGNERNLKLRMDENAQKSKYDQTVKQIAFQTKNAMGMVGEKNQDVEYLREEIEDKKYIKV